MKTEVAITMTLTELKNLKQSTELAMKGLKEKIGRLDEGQEKDRIIYSYKELEKFKDRITY